MESGVSPLLRPYLSLCIVVPMTNEMNDKSIYDDMVQQINKNEVDATEVLANKSYLMKL